MQARRDAADSPRVRRLARGLALATALLIVYGSLFPFDLSSLRDIDPWGLLTGLSFVRASRGDLVSNLLLYAPLGSCLVLAWPARWTRALGLLCAVLAATMLSLGIELLQAHSSTRVSSLTDVALNAGGTAIGAVAALLYLAVGTTFRIPGAAAARPEPLPLVAIVLWLAFRLAPFVPTIDWQKYKDALKPLLAPDPAWFDVLRYALGWLVVAVAAARLWRRQYTIAALAALAAVVQIGRVVVVDKALSASELAALALCIPSAAVLLVLRERQHALVLSLMLVVVIAIAGLQPFSFQPQAQSFGWIPFMYSLGDDVELNYSVLLEKSFWYFSIIWLLTCCGASARSATLVTAAFLTGIEIVQLWIPGRSAEITDPLLALAIGALLALPGRDGSRPRK